jgi:hypothetical protein
MELDDCYYRYIMGWNIVYIDRIFDIQYDCMRKFNNIIFDYYIILKHDEIIHKMYI